MTKSATALAMKPKKPPAQFVTYSELFDLAQMEKQYAAACKAVNEIERKTKAARLALAQKVLGVQSEAELAALDPKTLDELMAVNEEKGLWRAEKKAPPFLFLKTWEGRRPSWRDEFVKVKSEADAEKITAETPTRYAYRVDVAV